MRILLLTHAFNSLTQRIYCELSTRGHALSVEFDIADSVTEEAVALWRPDLIIAPFLKRAIPQAVWTAVPCFIVHPGIVGDRGPSALDWAIVDDEEEWGVTVLQAEAEMDAGPVWASVAFAMRPARKSSLYRNEVTEAATRAVLTAVERFAAGQFTPLRPDAGARGVARPLMRAGERQIDWLVDTTSSILRQLRAADGFPGVPATLFGESCRLFDAWPETELRGPLGEWIARREGAICRATTDGALWIGHVRRAQGIKLPATEAFPQALALPERPLASWWQAGHATWQDIAYTEVDAVGLLRFEFYNGAMGTRQCQRLAEALAWASQRPTRVLVLLGGEDFWSNGIHLNLIEAAPSAADESWANINAMDDLAEAILNCPRQITIAALQGNAGAGGCFLARAADRVWVREGAILNPHYKNMGNLYGSEFWTYLLPPRVGRDGARDIMRRRLPMSAGESVRSGFYDDVFGGSRADFFQETLRRAAAIAHDPGFTGLLDDKLRRRAADEANKPLADYRAEELAEMRRNFYGFDPAYHVARHHFTHKTPHSWTPRHLARHRETH